eukprot:113934_1
MGQCSGCTDRSNEKNKAKLISKKHQANIHQQNMSEKQHKIDTSIFQNNDNKCNGINDCSSVKRIMTALSYYNETSSQRPNDFITICDEYYSKNYLQDYIHFICVHKNDINKDQSKKETC